MMEDKIEKLYTTKGKVIPEWIDVNGHMNVAYYLTAFDLAVDKQWIQLGITQEYIEVEKFSTFSVECHITYQQELKVDDEFRIESSILAYDEKRIHLFQTMLKPDNKEIVATAEWMILHINMQTRKVAPWPDKILETLEKMVSSQISTNWPKEAGKKMGIKTPRYFLVEEEN